MADDDAATWGPGATDPRPVWAPITPQVVDLQPTPPPNKNRGPVLLVGALAGCLAVAGGALAAVTIASGDSDKKGTDVVSKPDGGDKVSAVARFAAIPNATTAAGTARIKTTQSAFTDGEKVTSEVAGLVSFSGGAFDLTAKVDGFGGALSALPGLGEGQRVFSDGTTVWFPIPALGGAFGGADGAAGLTKKQKASLTSLLAGKKYIATPLHDPADDQGSVDDLSMLGAGGGASFGFGLGHSPDDVLGYLKAVSTDVRESGTETVGGEVLTRYVAGVDLDTLQRSLPEDDRDFDGYDFKVGVPHTFPVTVLVDSAGRLRSLSYTLDLGALLTPEAIAADHTVYDCPDADPALMLKAIQGDKAAQAALDDADDEGECTDRPARPEELVTTGTVELSDYGTPVAVTAPPAAEVLDEAAMEQYYKALFSGLDTSYGSTGSGTFVPVPTTKP